MTTAPALAAEASEAPSIETARTPASWLGWSIAAMGFAALALSLFVSLSQAQAEPLQAGPILSGVAIEVAGR